MRNPRFLLLAVLIGSGAWFGYRYFLPNAHVLNAPPRPGPVIAYGDSLTFGIGAPPDESYPAQLSRRLSIPIINRGVPGETIADAASRVDRDIMSARPSIVIVLLGGNDYLKRKDMAQSFNDLKVLVGKIQAGGAMVVLIGLNGVFPFGSIGSEFERVARETESLYIPNALSGVLGHNDLMSDTIHPNAKGYSRIADRVEKALKPYVDQVRPVGAAK